MGLMIRLGLAKKKSLHSSLILRRLLGSLTMIFKNSEADVPIRFVSSSIVFTKGPFKSSFEVKMGVSRYPSGDIYPTLR